MSRRARFSVRAGLTLAGLLALGGCGKKGPLIYPDLLVPEAPQAVQLEQRGNALQLSFSLPSKDRRGRGLKEPFVLQVQRRELTAGERGECGRCPQDYQPALKIDPQFPDPAMKFGNRVILLDTAVSRGRQYQYRLVAVTPEGAAGTPVETVRAMVCVPPPIPGLTVKPLHGGILALDMQGDVPDNAELVGYTVYRATGDEPLPFLPLASTLGSSRYEDQSVQRGISYRYAVRLVIRRWDDLLVSSELSPIVTATVSDDPQ